MSRTQQQRTLSYRDYRDCVLAGWLDKSIGGVIDAPLENQAQWLAVTKEKEA